MRRHFPTAQDILKRTSFPYLWLSQSIEVPYGVILAIGGETTGAAIGALSNLHWQMSDIHKLCDLVHEMRREIEAGNHVQ